MSADVVQVRHPELVRCGRDEGALDQIPRLLGLGPGPEADLRAFSGRCLAGPRLSSTFQRCIGPRGCLPVEVSVDLLCPIDTRICPVAPRCPRPVQRHARPWPTADASSLRCRCSERTAHRHRSGPHRSARLRASCLPRVDGGGHRCGQPRPRPRPQLRYQLHLAVELCCGEESRGGAKNLIRAA